MPKQKNDLSPRCCSLYSLYVEYSLYNLYSLYSLYSLHILYSLTCWITIQAAYSTKICGSCKYTQVLHVEAEQMQRTRVRLRPKAEPDYAPPQATV